MDVSVDVKGLEELSDRVKKVQFDLRKKGGRFALRKSANVVRDAAQVNADKVDDWKSPENIALNIAVRWSGKYHKATGDLKFRVGVIGGARGTYDNNKHNVRKRRVGKKYTSGGHFVARDRSGLGPGGETFHWRFLEFGTKKMDAIPFFLQALTDNLDKASGEFVDEYGKKLDRLLK